MPRNVEDFKRATPLRWEDLTSTQQRGVEREISRIGKQTRSGLDDQIATHERLAETAKSAQARKGNASKAVGLREVASELKDKPITLKAATSRRVDAVNRAVDHARAAGDALPGAGWYYQHSDEIMAGAGGVDRHVASAAAAALSPGKDPKTDELPAIHALMDLHQNDHTITAGGKTRKVSEIPSDELGGLVGTAAAERAAQNRKEDVPTTVTSSMDNLHLAGRGHAHNTRKAIGALRGEVAPEKVNDPVDAPKVASYTRAINHSESGTPEHLDYMGIAHHLTHSDPAQSMMMFSRQTVGGGISQHSPLSPDHDTAEDTWMHAISSGQTARHIGTNSAGTERSFSPAKRAVEGVASPNDLLKKPAGIGGDPTISRQGAAHAFNNKATRDAAARLSPVTHDQHGQAVNMPSIMVQEVAWTQFRRDAGGDAPYNRSVRAREAPRTPKIKPHPTLPFGD